MQQMATILDNFRDNPWLIHKGLKMWRALCKLQEPCTPKALLSNLLLLFSLRKSFTQTPAAYIGAVRNLVLRCCSWGQAFTGALLSFIVVNGLNPSKYQKVLDLFEVGTSNWSFLSLHNIKNELAVFSIALPLFLGSRTLLPRPPKPPAPGTEATRKTINPVTCSLCRDQATKCASLFSEIGCPLCGMDWHDLDGFRSLLRAGFVISATSRRQRNFSSKLRSMPSPSGRVTREGLVRPMPPRDLVLMEQLNRHLLLPRLLCPPVVSQLVPALMLYRLQRLFHVLA